MATPATGALIGTPASISASVLPQTEACDVEPLEAEHFAHQADRVGEFLLGRDHRAAARARPARHGRFRGGPGCVMRLGFARAVRRHVVVVHVALGFLVGRCRRGSALRPSRPAWSMVITCVWPRVNTAEPCGRGQARPLRTRWDEPRSASRPSGRTPSLEDAGAHDLFVDVIQRHRQISCSRPSGNCSAKCSSVPP